MLRSGIASVVSSLGLLGGLVAQGPVWVQKPVLSMRTGVALAFDEARGCVVLYGGDMRARDTETWERHGVTWTRVGHGATPGHRDWPGLAYAGDQRRIVLFSGRYAGGTGAETWTWDGVEWSPVPTAVTPPARIAAAMCYDKSRRRVVLFGGRDNNYTVNNGFLGDTWEFDGVTWSQRVQPSPSHRVTAMAYDGTHQRTVLFGGRDATYSDRDDTWLWDGQTWTRALPAHIPPARVSHAMAFHESRGAVVVYGGLGGIYDVWEWNGSDWVSRPPGPQRVGHAMTYDRARQRLVVVGTDGSYMPSPFSTLEGDGANWSEAPHDPGPESLVQTCMCFDDARGVAVLFGGKADHSVKSDTWEWDGAAWTMRLSTGPSARWGGAMAWHAGRQRATLFGGWTGGWALGDTWEWDGAAWSQRVGGPAARMGHSMVYDALRQCVVLFGGWTGSSLFADTWELNGVAWSPRLLANGPSGRVCAAMAYDAARARTVLVGGEPYHPSGFDDTWEWDGTQWRQAFPATRPPARRGAACAYDAALQRTVVFGGSMWATDYDDSWEWDGVNWTLVPTPTAPAPRSWSAMTWDSGRQHAILFGGSPWRVDTWLYGRVPAAESVPVGSGCAGSAGVPRLSSNLPTLGNRAVLLNLTNAPASAPAVFGIGVAAASQPLGGGCTSYVDDLVARRFALTDPAGFASMQLSLPNDPVFAGVTLWTQAVALDALRPAPGLVLTGGLGLRIGE